ncbi:MAG: alpha-amylase family protein [Planctomycetota bacterium]
MRGALERLSRVIPAGSVLLLALACGSEPERRPPPAPPAGAAVSDAAAGEAGAGEAVASSTATDSVADAGPQGDVMAPRNESARTVALRAWPDFPAFVWMKGGPDVSAESLAALRGFGIDAMIVEGAGESTVPREQLFFYCVDHAAGQGILGLAESTFTEALASKVERPVRPNCYNDRRVLQALFQSLEGTIPAHESPSLLAVAIDDEISVTRGVAPADFCHGPECLNALRGWVRERYPSLRVLNEQWESQFLDFNDVVPLTTTESFELNSGRSLSELRFTSWSDHLLFTEASFAAVVQKLATRARDLTPGTPVGLLGGQPASAFGGCDWWRLAQALTFLEVYDVGGGHEVARSFAPPDCRFLETFAIKDATRATIAHELSRRFARGDSGIILWSAADLFVERDLTRPTPQAEALRDLLPHFRTLRARLPGIRREASDIAIYYSQPSIRAGWLVDAIKESETWQERSSSFEIEHSSSMLARAGWIELLHDLGVPFHFLSSQEALSGSLLRHPPAILILPRVLALSDREVRALQRYVRVGGGLLADSHLGFFDENLAGRAAPALDDLFGIRRDRMRLRLEDLDEVHTVPTSLGLPLAEGHVEAEGPSNWAYGIRRTHGTEGVSIYLNADMRRYPELRLAPEAKVLRQRVLTALESRNACPWPRLDPHGVAAFLGLVMYRYRTDAGRVVIIWRRGESRLDDDEGPWGPRLVFRLMCGSPCGLEDLATGEVYPPREQHDLAIAANGVLVLRLLE